MREGTNMNIRQLKYFIAVAEELNIGRAAARLNVSQPPVTRQIQQIEEQLKAQLFIRNPRGVELTRAGEIFLHEARNIVGLLDQVGTRVLRASKGDLGRLDVGIFGSAIVGLIPGIIHDFKQRYPNVHVMLHAMDKISQLEALRNRSLDIGFNRLVEDQAGIRIEEIAREEILAVVASERAWPERITLEELALEPLILFPASRTAGFVDTVIDLFRNNDFKPNVGQIVGDAFTGMALVASGFGNCLVPESMTSVTMPGVTFRRLAVDHPVTVDLSCIYREDDSAPIVQNFLNVARNWASRRFNTDNTTAE